MEQNSTAYFSELSYNKMLKHKINCISNFCCAYAYLDGNYMFMKTSSIFETTFHKNVIKPTCQV
jgi:hypothetical protein